MRLTQLLKEIKWQASTLEMCMNDMVPLSLPIVKQLVETKRISAFHITDAEHLPKLVSLEGKSKSISAFNKADSVHGPASGDGMWTKGGVLVLTSGIVLAESISDLWSKPDEQGRRWISPGNAIDKEFSKKYKIIDFAPQLKPLRDKWEKFTSSYNQVWKTEPDLTKEEKAYFIKTYIDTAYKLMLENKEYFQNKYLNSNYLYHDSNWNEVVLTKIKVERIALIEDSRGMHFEPEYKLEDYDEEIQDEYQEVLKTFGKTAADRYLKKQDIPKGKGNSNPIIDGIKKKYKNVDVIKSDDVPSYMKKYGVKLA